MKNSDQDSGDDFEEGEEDEEDSEAADEYEQENVSDQGRRGKAGLHADDSEEEGDQKVLLDNLPQTEDEIKRMMRDVAGEMMKLEMVFFEEEESDIDVGALDDEEAKAEQEKRNQELSYMKQFWTIPISEDVTKLNWNNLA